MKKYLDAPGMGRSISVCGDESEPPHREAEGTFLRQGPCFCTKEPVPRPLPANPTAALEYRGYRGSPLVAAAFWKWAWLLSRNVSGLAVTTPGLDFRDSYKPRDLGSMSI